VVNVGPDRGRVEGFRISSSRDQPANRVDYLRPPSVVQANIEDTVRVACGAGDRLVDALSHPLRKLIPAPADHDPHTAPVHLIDLSLHGLVEEAHQGADLGARARPGLGRERVDGEDVHTEILAVSEGALSVWARGYQR